MVADQPTGYSRWKDADPELTAVAKSDGTYSIAGVPAGTYTAYFDDSAWSGAVAPQYYGGTPNISLAKPFVVGSAATTTVSATLARGASVSGKITDSSGKLVPDSAARVALKLTVDGKTVWQWGAIPTDPTGTFSEKGLPAGTYAVGYAADVGFADSYYGGGHSFDTATNFVLTAGSSKTGVNGVLLRLLTAPTPTITGTRSVGSTLTAHAGAWTTGAALTYQWFANGVYITGSTSTHPTLALTGAQKGKQISVKVTGKKSGYAAASRTSARTAKIALTAVPTITGIRTVGSTLTAHPGTWTAGTVFTYRWYASGVAISGATQPTVTLTSLQRGKTVKVVVTGSDPGYQTISRASASTAAIG
ncbi:hypothetical protein [Microbacterium mangrovi]|uniref:hypothetical protein n=1 Tax=Microbacterium mangrovi TaxID=1348253 RepID=UPI00069255A1|nr:hypothetical protein [Microbacterium mangrovi]